MDKNDNNEFDLSKYNHYLSVKPPEDYNPDDIKITSVSNEDIVNDDSIKTFENDAKYQNIDSPFENKIVSDNSEDEVTVEPNDDKVMSKKQKIVDFFVRNNHRNTKITALILVIAILLGAGGSLAYIYLSTRSEGYGDDGINYADQIDDSDYLSDDNHNFTEMSTVDSDSLNGFLYDWYNNKGEKMYNKNVINVLLCGVENSNGINSGVASAGRSDSMIIVSIDKKNKTIKMVSLFRDSWTYMSVPRSDGTSYDYYFKLNSAYNFGGPANLIKTIENDFKVEIDQYVAVDFASFKKLIDAVGGIRIDVEEYEARYIRRTSKQTNFPYGKNVKLNGTQALIYSRIRHCDNDGDISRTRRQRKVIKALITSAKTATKGQLVNAFKQVKDYMRTGYTQSQVLKLIAQAVSHDWMQFEMSEMTLPNEDGVDCVGGYIGSQWAWAVDYPICAQKLQNFLYGKTNITLKSDRLTILDYIRGTSSGNSSSDYSNSEYTTQSSYSDNNDEDEDASYYYEKTTASYDEEDDYTTSYEEEPADEPVTEEIPDENSDSEE